MAEAEDVITDAAHHATSLALDYWKRRTHRDLPYEQTLAAHKQRLEILLISLFNRKFPLRIAEPPARPTILTRLFTRRPKRLFQASALPAQNGQTIFLPADLSAIAGYAAGTKTTFGPEALPEPARFFRAMAIQQGQRCLRHNQGLGQSHDSLLETMLFQLIEAANADYDLVQRYPGLNGDLRLIRQHARHRRPVLQDLPEPERDVESLYQNLLASAPEHLAPPFRRCLAPQQSADWAREMASKVTPAGQRFLGIEHDLWLGAWLEPESAIQTEALYPEDPEHRDTSRLGRMQRRPQVRQREEDEDDQNQGFWMVQPSAPIEHVEDPMGMQRPTDREEQADPNGLADSLSELPEAGVVSTPEPAREILASEDKPHRQPRDADKPGTVTQGIRYPEWDYRLGAYLPDGTCVHLCAPVAGDALWVEDVQRRHRKRLADIRRRFEALRTRRQIQRRQIDGTDVDIAEYVSACCDRQAGLPMSDRLFLREQNLRRDCAIMLLIDISGSTDAWVSQQQRIIDVAKESLLLVTCALDALGDPYAIQAFSGEGPDQVRVTELKAFADRSGPRLHQHIAGLEPDRYTRVGAALRHATASLMQAPAQKRLLLLLSDGKPNDLDQYESRYGVEDSRQAIREAVLQGVHPFCLTIDREAPEYLPQMFGPARFAVLSQIHRLPAILLELLRHFARS